jgi:transposase
LIHRAAEILAPLYDALLARIVGDAHCQADETSFRLQNRPDKRGFVWTFLTGKQIAYVFSGDRSGQTPSRVLGGTTGSLVVDAYTGYNNVTDVDGRTRCGCFSHARRYLFRALEQTPEARDALDMILELFRVERDAINQGLFGTDEHLAMRRVRSQPVLDQLRDWIDQQRPKHLPEGPMGAALRYISNQWKPLTVFMSDSKIPIHNNASESALRIIALARNPTLFLETKTRLATSLSCIHSCRPPNVTASTLSRTSRTCWCACRLTPRLESTSCYCPESMTSSRI